MKIRLIVFCISNVSFVAQTQVTRSDIKSLIPSIEKVDWKYTFKRSGELLEANPSDHSEMHAMMVYIRWFPGAGLVSEHKLSYKKREEAVRSISQHVLMAARPCAKDESGGLSTIHFENDSSI